MKFSITTQVLLIALGVVIVGELVFLFFYTTDVQSVRGLNAYAAEVVAVCKDAPHHPTCYEKEIPKLLMFLSMEKVFDVIRIVKKDDSSYRFCHVLAHEIGGREVTKDLSKWFDVIPKCPSDGLCSNGCVHGAAVARFAKETLSDEEIEPAIADLSIACEARDGYNPTSLDQAICYHGIGHISVHLTNAHIQKSLEICDRVAVKEDGRNFERVCDEGVFMQLFQPLEPEDFALIDQLPVAPTKENLATFCADNSRTTAEQSACWREGWPFYREEIHTPEGIVAFCSNAPNETEVDKCYDTTLSIIGRTSIDDPQTAQRICVGLPQSRQGQCFAIAAGAILEEDRNMSADAVSFCGQISSELNRTACYDKLVHIATFVFHPTDLELKNLCSTLPSLWQQKCRIQTK